MESVLAAAVMGMLMLLGVLISNSKSRAVMEFKIDTLTEKVSARSHLIERTYQLEQDMAVAQNDIDGEPGDQTGWESSVHGYYEVWDGILHYLGGADGGEVASSAPTSVKQTRYPSLG